TIRLLGDRLEDNHPFFTDMVREFYTYARRPHPKLPLVRRMQYGVAVCVLPADFDQYFAKIDAAGRRNVKKASRQGYSFARTRFNDHLAYITEIRRSTDTRQGKLSDEFLQAEAKAVNDPDSLTAVHDYPTFGVFKEGKL